MSDPKSISIGGLNYESGLIPSGGGAEIMGNLWRGGLEIQPGGHSHGQPDNVYFKLREADNHISTLKYGVSGYPHNYMFEPGKGVYLTTICQLGWLGRRWDGFPGLCA